MGKNQNRTWYFLNTGNTEIVVNVANPGSYWGRRDW